MTNENEKQKYVQAEIPNMKKRGGWRGGGRPKGTKKEFSTVAIRIDERLVGIVERLKKEIANENHNLILKIAKTLDEENVTHFVEEKEALNIKQSNGILKTIRGLKNGHHKNYCTS